jgi:hypothetical protein
MTARQSEPEITVPLPHRRPARTSRATMLLVRPRRSSHRLTVCSISRSSEPSIFAPLRAHVWVRSLLADRVRVLARPVAARPRRRRGKHVAGRLREPGCPDSGQCAATQRRGEASSSQPSANARSSRTRTAPMSEVRWACWCGRNSRRLAHRVSCRRAANRRTVTSSPDRRHRGASLMAPARAA